MGEWLIPPTLGMKIIPIGPSRAISCASCPAPLGSSSVGNPRPRAASPITCRISGVVSAGTLASDSAKEIPVPLAYPRSQKVRFTAAFTNAERIASEALGVIAPAAEEAAAP